MLTSAIHNDPAGTTRLARHRRLAAGCVAGWTVLVVLAVWWLLVGRGGPSVLIIHQAEPLQSHSAEKFRGWFKTDAGLERIYPWVLFGPYVVLLASYFPIERGRLRLSLPLNLAACVGFVAASHALNVHTRLTTANVTIVRFNPAQPGETTNSLSLFMTDSGNLEGTQMPPWWDGQKSASSGTSAIGQPSHLPGALFTNAFVQLRKDFGRPPRLPGLPNLSEWSLLLDLLAYGAVVGLAHSVHFYRRFRERERRALFLESNLAQARLNALRAQLQPHFLFNSLNAIAALLRRDPRLAETTLLSLSELLRLTISQSERPEVPLGEELELVQRYLEIQQARFGDRLRVERDIESSTLSCLVPTLLLQPLVENALRHGIEPADDASLVRLTAHQVDGRLELTVEDDGVGLAAGAVDPLLQKGSSLQLGTELSAPAPAATPSTGTLGGAGTGIGLSNLKARLETLYGAQQTLELLPRPAGGLVVRIRIPWHPAGAAGSEDGALAS